MLIIHGTFPISFPSKSVVWVVLDLLVSKLRHGGTLIIEGTDLIEIARYVVIGQISSQEAYDKLYNGRMSVCDLVTMSQAVNDRGITLINQKLTEHVYSIVGKRPDAKAVT